MLSPLRHNLLCLVVIAAGLGLAFFLATHP